MLQATRYLDMPRAALAIFAACVAALGFALVMQYGFHLAPCVLCLWQRVPYIAAGALALLAFLWRPYGGHTHILLMLAAAAFLANAGLAFFHSGVERGWWAGTSGCAIHPLHGQNVDSLRRELLAMATGTCDEISWTFLGLSMANWNVPISLVLAGFAALAGRRAAR
jgi:disulfide bond formation protein DsbB